MKLTDRLGASRKRRAATRAEPTPAQPPQARLELDPDDELVIDLRDPVHPDTPAPIAAAPCPNCGERVRIDAVDTISGRVELACPTCGFTFHDRLPRS